MSGFPYGEVLNFVGLSKGEWISGKNKPVLRFMALLLVMDSASPTLLSRAHQGQPLAIAALIHQNLDSDEIDVTAWKKQGLLNIDLMSFERLVKTEMLPTIRQTLANTAPKGIRAIKVSSYVYGEEMPCWMERMGATADLAAVDTIGGAAGKSLARSSVRIWANQLGNRWQDLVLGRHQRRLATGAITSLVLVAAALSISLNRSSPTPSFANQAEENRAIKARTQKPKVKKARTANSKVSKQEDAAPAAGLQQPAP